MSARGLAHAILVAGVLLGGWEVARDQRAFPHGRHAKLFPTCTGCHEGIVTGDSAAMYPPPALCARCHDGRIERRVQWSGPTPMATNLRFSHAAHARDAATAGDSLGCATCHAARDSARVWMAVAGARPTSCLQCHAHRASGHLADDARCTTCHVPLADARALPDSVVAALPRPPSHDRPDFISSHAPTATADEQRCATCHSRESCERCHANAGALAAVARLPRDARVARLVAGRSGAYPVPPSHDSASWPFDHAGAAREQIASCANCHTQPSCTTCHTGRAGTRTIAKLPRAVPGHAQGVPLRAASRQDSGRVHVVRVHAPGFATTHGPAAASSRSTCAGCHEQEFCANCHTGEARRRFHPENFLARHSVEAYGRESDCARCHSPEAFCRTCHVNVGLATRTPSHAAFHTRQPVWLLQHGQAARQSLESCASCHQQRDCMRCHSTAGWAVNPHGPDFDAGRMAARNRLVCLRCHLSDPLAAPSPR